MGIDTANIHSLSDFQRHPKDYLRRLKESGEPNILTVNGEAELVVQSAQGYQKLLDDQDCLEIIQGIGRGLEQSRRGEGHPMREFVETLAREHEVPLK